jgi:hypothetical protein
MRFAELGATVEVIVGEIVNKKEVFHQSILPAKLAAIHAAELQTTPPYAGQPVTALESASS